MIEIGLQYFVLLLSNIVTVAYKLLFLQNVGYVSFLLLSGFTFCFGYRSVLPTILIFQYLCWLMFL